MLINKAGIRTADRLEEFEFAAFLIRAQEPMPRGALDFAHYCKVHQHLFQDVYDWAGQVRTIRIGKGGNWFCFPEHIEAQATQLFQSL